jgi:polyhydroxybutyrate depolymerase
VHVPPTYQEGTPMPLVLMLHGYSANGESQAAYLGLNEVADERGFLLVKVDGTQDRIGNRFWNASPACCGMYAASLPDDVAYLTAVLDDVESAYTVDTHR